MDEDSFDRVTSDLICSEADLDDPETVPSITDDKDCQSSADKASSFGGGGSDSMIALPSLSDGKFALMVQEEKNYMPKDDYLERLRTGDLDMSVRRQALDWILKAHAHYGFGELAFYLAMNYLDRFLSVFELPGGKGWAVQLLAVACLSLGVKMVEVEVPLIVDLQVGDPKFVFEAKTIRRMELLVLSNLKWKMNPCTPYSFIDYFLRKIIFNAPADHDDDDQQPKPPPDGGLIGKAVKLILCTIKGIDFLEFKPSEIAAAVAILVAGETTQAVDIEKALSCFIQIEKVAVISVVPTVKKIRFDYCLKPIFFCCLAHWHITNYVQI
ncbi:OLC1v1011260C2 [Oldenlandia corymbosa var. corymbosa]|uniref:OLC1v1011260C2 n=1 Tax=Oldenlandia corymbosa var. corymbosa TaxID=529605 RepID=A0AAV1DWF3_OLDCO|nr:OLC1v1011260C2 [Oldenlandia corymbosa var. corymbosa]